MQNAIVNRQKLPRRCKMRLSTDKSVLQVRGSFCLRTTARCTFSEKQNQAQRNDKTFFVSLQPQEQKDRMTKQGTIVVVDDNKGILVAVRLLLGTCFEKVLTLPNPNQLLATLRDEPVDLILLDMNFSVGLNNGNEGLFWLSEIRKADSSIPVVLFTAYADIDLAVRGIKEGAFDFVVKPWDNTKLLDTLRKAYAFRKNNLHENEQANDPTDKPTNESGMFWGASERMKQLYALITKVAKTDANLLITGENGTGKEMLAREIHRLSGRRQRPMVTVDMGAVSETLFESELFGHVKGSFTDARTDRPGKFETADDGTLFLDEIGNLPYHLQAKLLTVLQRRSIVRIGSNTPIPVNIRLICATNRDLEEMVRKGDFREDLLYRINTIHIEIPPLRERPEDIVPLTKLFLSKYAGLYGKPFIKLTPDAEEKLKAHPWYGNIRELEHTVEKAVIMADREQLDSTDFDFPPTRHKASAGQKETTLEEMEYRMIKEAMEKYDSNLSVVANRLGISRQTLYNKLKRYEL